MPELTPSEAPRSKKQEIVSSLPKNLIEELSAHLQAAQIEEDNYRTRQGLQPEPFTKKEEYGLINGRLFEILVEMEFSPNQPEIAKTLLALMQNPDRCRELNLRIGKNPDLTFIEIDEVTGLPIVKAIGDAKLGRWDDNMRQQLVLAPKTLNRVLGAIQRTKDEVLDKLYLSVFTGKNKKISPSKSLDIIIFVPSDVDQNKWEDNIKVRASSIQATNPRELEEKIREEKIRRVREMRQKGIKVVKSSFSRKEVGKLADIFYAEILAAREGSRTPVINTRLRF